MSELAGLPFQAAREAAANVSATMAADSSTTSATGRHLTELLAAGLLIGTPWWVRESSRRRTVGLSVGPGGDAPENWWQADVETDIFFNGDKSDFRTPDFLVYRCQDNGGQDLHAQDVVLVGEVLSPANSHDSIETKKAKYASAGIPWYWEADINGDVITAVRAYALELSAVLPEGVVPLRPRNYILVGKWTPVHTPGIQIAHPFPIDIDWNALKF